MTLQLNALRNTWAGPFSLSVDKGGCLAVTGASGSGKSVFLRMLADMDPSEGSVILDGVDRIAMLAPQWRKAVSLVPAQAGWWTPQVGDHFPKANLQAAAELTLRLRLPKDILERQVLRLSTGERQRLALIRAVVARPRVLLLDEPTSSLDEDSAGAVESVLAELQQTGLILVLVTHDSAQADRLGNQTVHIAHGKVATP
jgi:ABC-type iron transport system FetAB ATPase subunit